MTSGGARVRSGPTPDFTSLKRDRDGKEWTKLPRECTIPAPDWPAVIENPTVAELALWDDLWKMPQAHVWHADRVALQVALYCRMFVAGSKPRASSQLLITLRQAGDHLLLSIPALHSARYVITGSKEDEILSGIATGSTPAASSGGASRRGRSSSSARNRMQVVPNPEPGPEPTGGDEE